MSCIGSTQGAALTAEQILYEGRTARNPLTASVEENAGLADKPTIDESDRTLRKGDSGLNDSLLPDSADVDGSNDGIRSTSKELSAVGSAHLGDGFQSHGRYFRLSMVISVVVAVAVSSSGVSTVGVISAAQVGADSCLCCSGQLAQVH